MTTTQTMTTPEAIGRSLAAIAVEVNDFGPPTYRKYIRAFEQAYPVLKQARELGPAKIKDEVIAALRQARRGATGVSRHRLDPTTQWIELGLCGGPFRRPGCGPGVVSDAD
jgi:hypothetical protein